MTLFDSELPADSRSGSSLDTLSRPHDDVAHSRCGRIDVVVWLRSPGLGQHEKERTCFASTLATNKEKIMRSYMWTAVLLAAALLVTGNAKSQQQPAAGGNPLDVVPEKMPFNTPYGTPISLEKAQAAVQAAVAEANKRGWPLNVAVVDSAASSFAHGWRAACLNCHLRAQGTGRSKISSANQSDRRRRTKRNHHSYDTRRCDRLARRHSVDRGRKAYWRHRLLERYRVSGRGGVLGRCGYDQQVAGFARPSVDHEPI